MPKRFLENLKKHPQNSEGEHAEKSGTEKAPKIEKSSEPTRDPYRRECEFEPGYDWRTDDYYNEDAIRARLESAKAALQQQKEIVNERTS